MISELNEIWNFFLTIISTFKHRKIPLKALLIKNIAEISIRSIGTVLFAGFFVGAILVVQFQIILAKYEASSLLGGLSVSATIREIGPLLISFLLAGKIGAFTAAELGTMRVTDQIDAIKSMGINPIEYLILPRFFGIIISSALLLFFGILVGIIGSVFISDYFYHLNVQQFILSIPRFSNYGTFIAGLFKSIIYGTIVALISTCKGYHAKEGAAGVGRAVTQSAIYINLSITIANSLSSFVIHFIQEFISNLRGIV